MKKIAFEFPNQLSPSYVEPLLLHMEDSEWYGTNDLKTLLQRSIEIDGTNIARINASGWSLAGITDSRTEKEGRSTKKYVRLTSFGRSLRDVYSTNRDLFFDLFHYAYYTAWKRSHDMHRARFWVYSEVCSVLWSEAPQQMDSYDLTNRLQSHAQNEFLGYSPAFPERSVRGTFTWLAALTPPFLEVVGSRNQYGSQRRTYCSPQLFHLAVDLVYALQALDYGTSLSVSDYTVAEICKTCLLDPNQFWSMADLAAMMMREVEIKRSQWGRSLVLSSPPTWIDLPDFSIQNDEIEEEEDLDEDGDTDTDDQGGELWN